MGCGAVSAVRAVVCSLLCDSGLVLSHQLVLLPGPLREMAPVGLHPSCSGRRQCPELVAVPCFCQANLDCGGSVEIKTKGGARSWPSRYSVCHEAMRS